MANPDQSGIHDTERLAESEPVASSVALSDLARVFLKVGATGFGGAMPMLAMVQGEVVERRRWVSQEEFGEAAMLGQILPGPVAVDAVVYLGYHLRGWPGAIISFVAFILPSFLLMLGLTLLYLSYGQMPQLAGALKGLGAAVVALIATAAYRMGKPALKDWRSAALLVAALLALVILQANVVLVVLLAGLAGLLLYRGQAPTTLQIKGRAGGGVAK
jgi:chromate transporter